VAGVCVAQCSAPSHFFSRTTMEPLQEAVSQTVSVPQRRQDLEPLQKPSSPQVAGFDQSHSPCGSVFAGTGSQ
jgi:hypothetical protein